MKTLLLQNEDSLPGTICPNCESSKIHFDLNFGFYKCESCGVLWAYDKDDPDYEEEESLDQYFSYGTDYYPA